MNRRYDYDEQPVWRRVAIVGVLLAFGALVVALVVGLVPGFRTETEVREYFSPVPAGTTGPSSVPEVASEAPVLPTVDGAPTPIVDETVDPTPVQTVEQHIEVTTLQIVPPMRDVIVVVNGRSYASDSSGTISLASLDRGAVAEVVGLQADPPLTQVVFTGWADGTTDTTRWLASIDGPVVQLGFDVSFRVSATATVTNFGTATATFASVTGPLTLPLDEPTWVLAARAVPSDDLLVVQELSYTSVSIDRSSVVTALAPGTYAPAPEAIWQLIALSDVGGADGP